MGWCIYEQYLVGKTRSLYVSIERTKQNERLYIVFNYYYTLHLFNPIMNKHNKAYAQFLLLNKQGTELQHVYYYYS